MNKSYKVNCVKCGVEYLAERQRNGMCPKCFSFYKLKKGYPKLFYKNRKIVIDRDEYKCQCCGCESNGQRTNKLIIHHLDCDKGNNSLSNLITLCGQCHASIHKKYKKPILRKSNIYKLFAQEKQFGEFGKSLIYEPAKKIVKKQFSGRPILFFKS